MHPHAGSQHRLAHRRWLHKYLVPHQVSTGPGLKGNWNLTTTCLRHGRPTSSRLAPCHVPVHPLLPSFHPSPKSWFCPCIGQPPPGNNPWLLNHADRSRLSMMVFGSLCHLAYTNGESRKALLCQYRPLSGIVSRPSPA